MAVDFMILGAQKAATSSLQYYLRAVPGVFMPPGESAFFEDPEYVERQWERFPEGPDAYVVAGIKRPDVMCRETLIDRVSEALPDAKFLVVLRDPVARAMSAHYHLVRHAHLPLMSADESLRNALREHRETAKDTVANSLIRFGLYGHYLARWLEHYPPERFLILSQTSVAADAANSISRCCAHIGVSPGDLSEPSEASENVGLYDPRYIPMYRFGHVLKTRPIGDQGRRVPRRNRVMRGLGAGLTTAAQQLASRQRRPGPISADTRARLVDVYRPDLELLRSLVPAGAVDWVFDDGLGDS
jgi:hypothetical protein